MQKENKKTRRLRFNLNVTPYTLITEAHASLRPRNKKTQNARNIDGIHLVLLSLKAKEQEKKKKRAPLLLYTQNASTESMNNNKAGPLRNRGVPCCPHKNEKNACPHPHKRLRRIRSKNHTHPHARTKICASLLYTARYNPSLAARCRIRAGDP